MKLSIVNRAYFFIVLFSLQSWALNPIHEATYSLLPRNTLNNPAFSFGGYFTPGDNVVLNIPLAISFMPTSKLELGGGLKSSWMGNGDNFPWVVFGAKLKTSLLTYHLDFLLSTASSTSNGLTVGSYLRRNYFSSMFYRLTARLGLFDGLTNDALMAMELAYYPTLKLIDPVWFELGLITSSQTNRFENNLAMDIQPGLIVNLKQNSQLVTLFAFGLAGDQKESTRIKIILQYSL